MKRRADQPADGTDAEVEARDSQGGRRADEGDAERQRPADLVPVRTTPPWTAATVPGALLSSHHTSVWAQLDVSEGTVVFTEDDGWSATARPGHPVTIVPDRPHAIAPSDDAVFAVTFFGPAADHR